MRQPRKRNTAMSVEEADELLNDLRKVPSLRDLIPPQSEREAIPPPTPPLPPSPSEAPRRRRAFIRVVYKMVKCATRHRRK